MIFSETVYIHKQTKVEYQLIVSFTTRLTYQCTFCLRIGVINMESTLPALIEK